MSDGGDLADLERLLLSIDRARAIGAMLRRLRALARPNRPLRQLVDGLCAEVAQRGLYALAPSPDLAMPRPFEVAAAVNRLRGLAVAPGPAGRGEPVLHDVSV